MLRYAVSPMRNSVLAAGLIALGVGVLRMRGQEAELDSLTICKDTQKLLFENSFVRIIDDVIPPGVAEPMHRHPHGVVVTIVEADAEVTNSAGETSRTHFKVGAGWQEATVHRVKNVGKKPTHWIRIDVK